MCVGGGGKTRLKCGYALLRLLANEHRHRIHQIKGYLQNNLTVQKHSPTKFPKYRQIKVYVLFVLVKAKVWANKLIIACIFFLVAIF
jgi:hypothetical protein